MRRRAAASQATTASLGGACLLARHLRARHENSHTAAEVAHERPGRPWPAHGIEAAAGLVLHHLVLQGRHAAPGESGDAEGRRRGGRPASESRLYARCPLLRCRGIMRCKLAGGQERWLPVEHWVTGEPPAAPSDQVLELLDDVTHGRKPQPTSSQRRGGSPSNQVGRRRSPAACCRWPAMLQLCAASGTCGGLPLLADDPMERPRL